MYHGWQHNDFELTEFKSERGNDATMRRCVVGNICQTNCKAFRMRIMPAGGGERVRGSRVKGELEVSVLNTCIPIDNCNEYLSRAKAKAMLIAFPIALWH